MKYSAHVDTNMTPLRARRFAKLFLRDRPKKKRRNVDLDDEDEEVEVDADLEEGDAVSSPFVRSSQYEHSVTTNTQSKLLGNRRK